ncbi:MAG: phasin family protein, partial [Thiotrichales bacterium]
QKELFELATKMSQSVLDSAQKLSELNVKTLDKVVAQQSALASAYFDASTKGLELMSKAKGYQELLAGQAQLMRELGETVMNSVKQGASTLNEVRTEYSALAETNVKVAQEQINEVSKVTRKAA